jgi:hypothetical protein
MAVKRAFLAKWKYWRRLDNNDTNYQWAVYLGLERKKECVKKQWRPE